jgi:acylphosphatase
MPRKHLRIIVSGLVQGVGYRAAALRKARDLGLAGTVRNSDDGGVVIEAEGSPADLEAMVQWCHRGPAMAQVSSVEIAEGDLTGQTAFDVIR